MIDYKKFLKMAKPIMLVFITSVFIITKDSGLLMICGYLILDYVHNNF